MKEQKVKTIALVTISISITTVFIASFVTIRRQTQQAYEKVMEEVSSGRVVDQVQAAEAEVEYDLLEGWNLVAMAVRPSGVMMASDLIREFNEAGALITTVSVWRGNRWESFVKRQEFTFGDDFELDFKAAYFLRNHREGVVSLKGEIVNIDQLEFSPGWNGVALPVDVYESAERFLKGVNGAGERVTEVDDWESGRWEPVVMRVFAPDNAQIYGFDYGLQQSRGYMVKSKQNISINLNNE